MLCCPLTPQTTGLMSRDRIARMKPGALVINVARGPVLDEEALVDALREGRIGGAALDVFSTQPLPADHPFFTFDNVIVTPHMAGITRDSMMRMGTGAAAEAVRVSRRQPARESLQPGRGSALSRALPATLIRPRGAG